MKHLGSALLLGVLLAMVFVLAYWLRTTASTEHTVERRRSRA